jgi:uncharacterized protein YodC (DUF2158 family)
MVKPGDVVRLKSGGPLMTVARVDNRSGEMIAVCEWFDEKSHRCHGAFHANALKVTV